MAWAMSSAELPRWFGSEPWLISAKNFADAIPKSCSKGDRLTYRRRVSGKIPPECLINLSHSLQWRHNGNDSVSNHQPHNCLLNRLFRRRSKKTSKLRVTGLCAGNSPHKWPVTRKMFPFDDVIVLSSVLFVPFICGMYNRNHVHLFHETPSTFHIVLELITEVSQQNHCIIYILAEQGLSERRLYIRNVVAHWLRPCLAINRKRAVSTSHCKPTLPNLSFTSGTGGTTSVDKIESMDTLSFQWK